LEVERERNEYEPDKHFIMAYRRRDMNLANISSLPVRRMSLVYSACLQEQHDSTQAEG